MTVFARTDVVTPYAQALRIMAKNSMLWVMFLACMATSVFFSFDSRFNVVFPKEQRERVSELRATNQVSAIIADIGTTIANQELTQTSTLFQSEGWHAYEGQLDRLATAAQGSTGEIEKYFNDQIEVAQPRHQGAAGAHHHRAERPGRHRRQEDVADRRAGAP